ncbi:MAG: UvrD-helicase domain-containing protein [Bacteroidia bacterium]|nr:UvrD-helicase domain-containing protein [Bacteroidia bacterium]
MSNYLENLNSAQRDAVINTEGASLVIAGAGSGKTRVLTYRIAHLLTNGVPPSAILALTFTNKAAREMKERIATEVGNNVSRHLWMGTFHAIFSRILRAEAATIGYPSTFTIYDTQDSKSLIKSVIKSLNLEDATYKPGVILSRISTAKNNLITPVAYHQNPLMREADQAARIPRTGEIYLEYSKRCKNAGAMDFDDLLLITNILFKNHPEILSKYQQLFRYILVDEYQDTNFSQYLIVKRLAEIHQNICVVGDDAQSIYSFRGARIENILNFKNDYSGYSTYKLEQNYRSTQVIVDAANSLIAKNKHQLPKTVFSENALGERIKVLTAMNEHEEGYLVANEIFDHRMKDHENYSDFAILYRTNAQSRVFEEILRKRNIPYKIYGGLSFYQRKEIKDILSYFRLIINTKDDESFKRIINYPARGIGATTLNKLEDAAATSGCSIFEVATYPEKMLLAGLNAGVIRKISVFTQLISKFAVQFTTTEAYEMANKIASESGILTELYQDKSPENLSRYENTQELLNAIQDFSLTAKEEGRPDGLQIFMEDVALLTDQDNDKDSDADKVTLMTVHSSKGLEFKNVFIVGLEENLFPSGFSGTLTLSELEEERRLFYVALTRSENQAWLSFAQQRFRWGKAEFCNPSRFIGEIDHQFLEIQNSRSIPQFRNHELMADSSNRHLQWEEKKYQPPRKPGITGQRIQISKSVLPSNSEPFQSDSPDKIKIGMFVEHERFGRGKVMNIEGKMPDIKAKVFFPNAGEKNLLLKFAKLRISDQIE